jgi:hypothetical protein
MVEVRDSLFGEGSPAYPADNSNVKVNTWEFEAEAAEFCFSEL